tara:strand:+ start:3246 stop:3401 length:156 start_codon:yes stop_codon:yes gene_type:complete
MVVLCILAAVVCMTVSNLSGLVFPSEWFEVPAYMGIALVVSTSFLIMTQRG